MLVPTPISASTSVSQSQVPLCVDLDGTLIASDLLWESLVALLHNRPWLVVLVPWWLIQGRAVLKRRLAENTALDPALLPFRREFLDFLRKEKAAGRRLLLVTASDETFARRVAAETGVFDEVMASDGRTNLKGRQKAAALVARFGAKGFDYAGDSLADVPVWAEARRAILVHAGPGTRKATQARGNVVAEFATRRNPWRAGLRLLRPHQWVKNLIVIVPLITSHQIGAPAAVTLGLMALAAFCCCASAVYVVNDLFDLEADRQHATKHTRPLASGDLSLVFGLVLAPVLLGGGFALAAAISREFVAVMAVYVMTSFAYAWWLKRKPLLDIFVLAGLYTLRLIAGHAATGVPYSEWLLAFSMFLFLSLALVKRYQEVRRLTQANAVRVLGRGYTADDLTLLTPLGAASGYLSVLVLALYVSSDKVRLLYQRPVLLLLICPLLLYWISRVWLVAHRGGMNDDPVVFALKDKPSYIAGVLTLVAVWLAT